MLDSNIKHATVNIPLHHLHFLPHLHLYNVHNQLFVKLHICIIYAVAVTVKITYTDCIKQTYFHVQKSLLFIMSACRATTTARVIHL